MVRIIRNNYLLLLITIFSFFLRWIQLETVPNGFHVDELNAGYIGNYIIQHGTDILGNRFPLTYNKFGDFRPTGIFYLSGLSVTLLGSSITAVRLPSALFGTLTVIVLYFFSMELFHKKRIALLSSLILSMLPWHIVLSRATSEGVIGLFFVTLGLTMILRFINTSKYTLFFSGVVFLLSSYFFYHSFRLITPLLVFSLLTLVQNKKQTYTIICLGIIVTSITAFIFLSPVGAERGNQVALYNSPDFPRKIQNLIHSDGPNAVFSARIFHNKPIVFFYELLRNYKEYYSPNFLGFNGGLPFRYVVPEFGLLSITGYLVFLFGLASFLVYASRKNSGSMKYLLLLLCITPIPGVITFEDSPNTHRVISMILPICVIIAWQVNSFLDLQLPNFIKRVFIMVAIGLCLWELLFFEHQYVIHTQSFNSYARNDGYIELIAKIKNIHTSYTMVYVPGYENLPLYYLFLTSDYQNLQFINNPNDVLLKQRGNVAFVSTWCASEVVKNTIQFNNTLVVDSEGCESDGRFTLIDTVLRKDTTKVFYLRAFHPIIQ